MAPSTLMHSDDFLCTFILLVYDTTHTGKNQSCFFLLSIFFQATPPDVCGLMYKSIIATGVGIPPCLLSSIFLRVHSASALCSCSFRPATTVPNVSSFDLDGEQEHTYMKHISL